MTNHSDIPTHHLSNLPPFSLADMALIHDATEEDVRRVACTLNLPHDGPFETEDFFRINRILMPVLEPYQIDLLDD